MNEVISFLLGLILGFIIFGLYSWILNKFNLLKRLGYNGSLFIIKWIIKKSLSSSTSK